MNYEEKNMKGLEEYLQVFVNDGNYKEAYYKYVEDIDSIKPNQAFQLFTKLLNQGVDAEKILTFLDKAINAFYKGLTSYDWTRPENDEFLTELERENAALQTRLERIKTIIKTKEFSAGKNEINNILKEILDFRVHYIKKENILFPYLEGLDQKFHGVSIMWELHNKVWEKLKNTIDIFENEIEKEKFNKLIADVIFALGGLIRKEEMILFPVAADLLSEEMWKEMYLQSKEYGAAFIKKEIKDNLDTWTGDLNLEEVEMIFNNLPVDMTFVDADNKVRYFSRPKDRIFPRSSGVIGREVKNCHPPSSVNRVEEIVESFRSGEKDSETFWINLKGKKILIQYFALRDDNGSYKGVLEVSQDITEIQSYEGEKRL